MRSGQNPWLSRAGVEADLAKRILARKECREPDTRPGVKPIMGSMFFHALRGTCLLATLASAGLWVRSFYVSDCYNWRPRLSVGAGFERVESRTVLTSPGHLVFQERSGLM